MIIALVCMAAQGAWAWTGSGSEADPYQISTIGDWKTLCDNVNKGVSSYKGKHFKLMADLTDIEVSLNVGRDGRYFEGTFDGNNHSLDISNFSYSPWAPFSRVRDATIKRLRVTGKITHGSNGRSYHGGIVGIACGNTTLVSCHCSVEFKFFGDYNSGNRDSESGGMVGWVNDDDGPATLTMVNCLFDGKIACDNADMVGGFIGLGRGGTFINLVNCLFDPKSVDIHESHYHSTFLAVNDSYRNKRTCTHYVKKNCFRKKKFGEAEGEDARTGPTASCSPAWDAAGMRWGARWCPTGRWTSTLSKKARARRHRPS